MCLRSYLLATRVGQSTTVRNYGGIRVTRLQYSRESACPYWTTRINCGGLDLVGCRLCPLVNDTIAQN
jgi:hypothetical protein